MSSVKIRDSATNKIKRYLQSSKDKTSALDVETVETLLQLLNDQWMRFCTAQEEVEIACGAEFAPIEEEKRVQTEEWYITAKANLKRLVNDAMQPSSLAVPANVSTASRLPKLQLPIFNGDPTDWQSFNDAFQSLVHLNAGLSDSQRLQYLRNCLKGEALQAWHLLTTHYKVLRVIVEGHLKALSSIDKANRDSGKEIKHVLNKTLQHVGSLRSFGRPVDFWDDWLVHLTVAKLAYETRKQWELSLINDNLPTFQDLVEFLETRARSLEMLPSAIAAGPTNQGAKHFNKTSPKSTTNVLHAVGKLCPTPPPSTSKATVACLSTCFYCNENHKIYVCPSFQQLNGDARIEVVKKHGACLNCLSKGHFISKCRSTSSCQLCHRRHHTLLHTTRKEVANNEELNVNATPFDLQQSHCAVQSLAATRWDFQRANPISTPLQIALQREQFSTTTADASPTAITRSITEKMVDSVNSSPSYHAGTEHAILLATAEIFLQDQAGRWQLARVLFDNGSHASFVTEACMQRLRLPRKPSSACITGIGSLDGGKVKGETSLVLSSKSFDQRFTISALILSKITNDIPTVNVQVSSWPHLQHLTLADQHYDKPGHIEILIGMDEMDKFLLSGFRKGPPGTPMAQNTTLGWVLFGNATRASSPVKEVCTLHCDVQLIKLVCKLWELDDFPPKKHHTAEEASCEEHFLKNFHHAEDGRYVARLPIKEHVPLGESRNIAINSLLRMEKRVQYCSFMQELIDMGHMELAPPSASKAYYMPHHAVVKDSSSTTKLRVVFNASMKTSSGFSLNDALMVGPQLQQDLFSILIRFRTHRYAVMADIEKMYRQVYVAKEDTDYQRIMWRDVSTDDIRDYRMLRVTYGVAAAAHLAVKSLQQAALDAFDDYEEAAKTILRDFYMDDLLTGSYSIEQLAVLQKNVTEVLSGRGFQLRKWATNCDELKIKLPHISERISHLLADGDEVRALGILWNTNDDSFSVAVNLKQLTPFITKRVFLADTSKIFDPLGLIAPCTIRSKIWLQQIWRADVNWDDPVPSDLAKEWLLHRQELSKLSSLKIYRWLGTGKFPASAEFHVFTDASERAYAAALYCCSKLCDGSKRAVLVAARAKVAPLKSTTLPRLELCAAHLGARLVRQVQISFGSKLEKIYAWTDSTITLAWLQGHPSRWSTFVANRVAEVQEILVPECWGHVRR